MCCILPHSLPFYPRVFLYLGFNNGIYAVLPYNCTSYMKFGKRYCPSHYIKMKDMERIVLEDTREICIYYKLLDEPLKDKRSSF